MVPMEQRKIDVDVAGAVSALWMKPRDAVACFVFAHGAGAGMSHPFLETVANGLFERNIATLRYQSLGRSRSYAFLARQSGRTGGPVIAPAGGARLG
jgi:predicted alpha/beta-hydrolase family hydrolase